MVLIHIVGLELLDENAQKRVKVTAGDGDGAITILDAIQIQQYVVGLVDQLLVRK